MTIQLAVPAQGKSKGTLEALLKADPAKVSFRNPALRQWITDGDFKQPEFKGSDIPLGGSFTCVLDPATRRRFAVITRTSKGEWRVR